MIKTIPFVSLDSFDKQNLFGNDPEEAESQTEDFAAFFCFPVAVEPVKLPVQTETPLNSAERNIEIPSYQIEIQSTYILPENFAQTTLILPPKAESETTNPLQFKDETISHIKLADFDLQAENLEELNFTQAVSEIDLPVKEDFGLPMLFNRHNTTDIELENTANMKLENSIVAEFENTANAEFTNIISSEIASSLNKRNFLAQIQTVNAEINQFSLKSAQKKLLGDIPKLFNEISNVVKAERSAKSNTDSTVETNSAPDFSIEEKTLEAVQPDFSGASEQNLDQTEAPKPAKEFKIQENVSPQVFEHVLTSTAGKPETTENVSPTNNLNETVFRQIEPTILQAANFDQTETEKRVLKIRLKPVELGTVEITLEKNDAGKIHAHFRTEREETQQILTDSIGELRSSLENSGLQIEDLEISCNLFSSNGDERRENQPKHIETHRNQTVLATDLDGESKIEDDEQSRLVSLRA